MNEVEDWQQWHAQREERLRRPHGVLSIVGTHWLGTRPAPILAGEPVLWSASPDGKAVVLTAKAEHGLFVDGEPVDGTVRLRVDTTDDPQTVSAPEYGILLVPIERDGRAALQVHDSKSSTLAAFAGIERFDFDPAWVVDAKFTAYHPPRAQDVLNTDGVTRRVDLGGIIEFVLADGAHTLQAVVTAVGMHIVFADPTTARSRPSFRFLPITGVAEDGSMRLDFNRAYLPQSAFSEHYVCAGPPRGNTLASPVRAGEFAIRTR